MLILFRPCFSKDTVGIMISQARRNTTIPGCRLTDRCSTLSTCRYGRLGCCHVSLPGGHRTRLTKEMPFRTALALICVQVHRLISESDPMQLLPLEAHQIAWRSSSLQEHWGGTGLVHDICKAWEVCDSWMS